MVRAMSPTLADNVQAICPTSPEGGTCTAMCATSPVHPSGREDCPNPVGERLAVAPTTWRDTAKCEGHADVRKLPSCLDDKPASKMSPVMKRKTRKEAPLTAGPALLGSAEATTCERPGWHPTAT